MVLSIPYYIIRYEYPVISSVWFTQRRLSPGPSVDARRREHARARVTFVEYLLNYHIVSLRYPLTIQNRTRSCESNKLEARIHDCQLCIDIKSVLDHHRCGLGSGSSFSSVGCLPLPLSRSPMPHTATCAGSASARPQSSWPSIRRSHFRWRTKVGTNKAPTVPPLPTDRIDLAALADRKDP